jgi:hypothetical protein
MVRILFTFWDYSINALECIGELKRCRETQDLEETASNSSQILSMPELSIFGIQMPFLCFLEETFLGSPAYIQGHLFDRFYNFALNLFGAVVRNNLVLDFDSHIPRNSGVKNYDLIIQVRVFLIQNWWRIISSCRLGISHFLKFLGNYCDLAFSILMNLMSWDG